jgi:tRNA nucleotidyltransferase (CCA-adding enzyme)
MAPDLPRPNVGPHPDEETALRALVESLARGLHPRSIYLFGSRAEGRARPDSDFDLLVVFDDDAAEEAVTYEAAYAPVCGSGVGCDIVPCRAAELDEVLHDPVNPWRLAWQNARRVYERG